MGIDDKIQETVGKAKEGVGEAVGSEDLRQDGQKDRLEAAAKELGDKVHEKFADVTGAIADKAEEIKAKFTEGDK